MSAVSIRPYAILMQYAMILLVHMNVIVHMDISEMDLIAQVKEKNGQNLYNWEHYLSDDEFLNTF